MVVPIKRTASTRLQNLDHVRRAQDLTQGHTSLILEPLGYSFVTRSAWMSLRSKTRRKEVPRDLIDNCCKLWNEMSKGVKTLDGSNLMITPSALRVSKLALSIHRNKPLYQSTLNIDFMSHSHHHLVLAVPLVVPLPASPPGPGIETGAAGAPFSPRGAKYPPTTGRVAKTTVLLPMTG